MIHAISKRMSLQIDIFFFGDAFHVKREKKKKEIVMGVFNELFRYSSVGALLYTAEIIWNCPCTPVPLCHFSQVRTALWAVLAGLYLNVYTMPDATIAYFLTSFRKKEQHVIEAPEVYTAAGSAGVGTASD